MTTIRPISTANAKGVSLTQNGNPYKKSTTASKVCTVLGAAPTAVLFTGAAFSNGRKGAGLVLAVGAVLTAISGTIGKFIGSIMDAQTNKTRMAQADGEAAYAAKNVDTDA